MNYNQLEARLKECGATKLIFKELSENDNSKNQVYLGGSYDVLQEIPHGEITVYADCARPNYKASLDFWWIGEDGTIAKAEGAQLILYPKYPEVRLSGFLKGCRTAPSRHMQPIRREERMGNKDGRVLIFGVVRDRIYAYLAPRNSQIANYLISLENDSLFGHVTFGNSDSKAELIQHLRTEYYANPHEKVRMYPDGTIRPYTARNSAGYTLEASFGIIPNGAPEPDFKGWELKCFNGTVITLMTPEPDGGVYFNIGAKEFVLKFGTINNNHEYYFTGPYYARGGTGNKANRKLLISGFNSNENKITDLNGGIFLVQDDIELASWSFSHVLDHWSRKHNKACYVRYENVDGNNRLINYLPNIVLGEGTSPILLLNAILVSSVYYDPAPKVDINGKVKARSQFRIKLKDINRIYNKIEHVNLTEIY